MPPASSTATPPNHEKICSNRLGNALAHWKQYAAVRDAHYLPALYNRLGYVNVTALTEKMAADLDIARNWKPGTLQDDSKRAGSEKGFRK